MAATDRRVFRIAFELSKASVQPPKINPHPKPKAYRSFQLPGDPDQQRDKWSRFRPNTSLIPIGIASRPFHANSGDANHREIASNAFHWSAFQLPGWVPISRIRKSRTTSVKGRWRNRWPEKVFCRRRTCHPESGFSVEGKELSISCKKGKNSKSQRPIRQTACFINLIISKLSHLQFKLCKKQHYLFCFILNDLVIWCSELKMDMNELLRRLKEANQ